MIFNNSSAESLKAEYERLKAEQEQATENSTFNFNKKKGISAEMKQYKEQKEEAMRYEKMLKEKVGFNLFPCPE
jgi:structural maintenance of chromosome 1